jgi:hypothetical protein
MVLSKVDPSKKPFGREPFGELRVSSRIAKLKAERLRVDAEHCGRNAERCLTPGNVKRG